MTLLGSVIQYTIKERVTAAFADEAEAFFNAHPVHPFCPCWS